ncbi:MAG: HlyD family efflux transporter periplasmic adaptor subunit [Clostridiales bacterium]|nr:HlyD family efflux transporter periplasmic adaptor subunit [Clostridiales bacterium]
MTEEKEVATLDLESSGNGKEFPKQTQVENPKRNPFADEGKKKKSRFSKKQKRIFFSSLAILFIILAVLSVKLLLDKSKKDINKTQTATVLRGRLESFVTGNGTVVPKKQETLGSKIKGKITEIYVKAGDRVKTGDKILTVDTELMQDDLDSATAAYDSAEESYRQVSEEIQNLTLKAPFNGKLVKLDATNIIEGLDISSGTAVGTFADDSKMRLSLYFNYGFIKKIKTGMDAVVSIPSSMSTVNGKVESVQFVKKINDAGAVLFKVNVIIQNPGTLTKDMPATAVIKTTGGNIMPAESGKLEYNKETSLTFKASGKVAGNNLCEYQEYSGGQTLCVLKSEQDPQKKLFEAKRKLDEAQKEFTECEQALSQSTITSPIDGIVTSILKESGDKIENFGTDIVVISDLSKMMVEIQVDEMDISKVAVGKPVTISYDKSDGTTTLTGSINSVSYSAKSDSNQSCGVAYFPAKILIDNPGDLMPGIGVNYRISSAVKEDCLMIPSAAVTYTEEGTAVFVKTVDGRKIEKPAKVPADQIPKGYQAVLVEAGISDNQNTEIVSGLIEGDEVVLIGQTNQNGMGNGQVAVAVG